MSRFLRRPWAWVVWLCVMNSALKDGAWPWECVLHVHRALV